MKKGKCGPKQNGFMSGEMASSKAAPGSMKKAGKNKPKKRK